MKKLLALTLFSFAVILPSAIAKECSPPLQTRSEDGEKNIFVFATDELWNYLRRGLAYLESPEPQLPPEAVSPSYVHPDGRGFGAYGFSLEAYEDVQRLYPFFKQYSWTQLLRSQELYDLANRAFCDWMLKNLAAYLPEAAGKKELFTVIQKAWNLGLGGFKQGRQVVRSRELRAEEFLQSNG